MGAIRQHADVLVLGHALPGALAATLLARRGWSVLWAGEAPSPFAKHGAHALQQAPGLCPPLASMPGLERVLTEIGALEAARALVKPAVLQELAPRLRRTWPDDVGRTGTKESFAALAAQVDELAEIAQTPVKFGILARRRMNAVLTRFAAARAVPEGPAGSLASRVSAVLGRASDPLIPSHAIAASPHIVTGGVPALVQLLQKRFGELGGRVVPAALDQAAEVRAGWSEVQVGLAGDVSLGARVLVFGADGGTIERLFPDDDPSARKFAARLGPTDALPLWRISFVTKRKGVPVPLGPAAFIQGEPPLLLERRALDAVTDELTAYVRGGSAGGLAEATQARLAEVLPFFERHIVVRVGPGRVAHEDALSDLPPRPARRVLQARQPTLGLDGLEGAALLAEALATDAMGLAPRKEVVQRTG